MPPLATKFCSAAIGREGPPADIECRLRSVRAACFAGNIPRRAKSRIAVQRDCRRSLSARRPLNADRYTSAIFPDCLAPPHAEHAAAVHMAALWHFATYAGHITAAWRKWRSDMSAQTTQSDPVRAVATRRAWSTFRAAHNLAVLGEQLIRLDFDRIQGDRRVGQQYLA